MRPGERTSARRRRRGPRRLAGLFGRLPAAGAAVLPASAAVVLPAAALAAADPGTGGAGRDVPSFLLPNLLAVAMSLTVLAIACKRFRKP